ncbi:hypothetical protein D9M68_864840 [compost metagenome]
MSAAGADEDDRLAGLQTADAVDDLDIQQRPALPGFVRDLGQGFLGHAGEMLEEHAADFATLVEVAHVADEADHRTDAKVGGMQGIQLLPRIERLQLDTNGHKKLSSKRSERV